MTKLFQIAYVDKTYGDTNVCAPIALKEIVNFEQEIKLLIINFFIKYKPEFQQSFKDYEYLLKTLEKNDNYFQMQEIVNNLNKGYEFTFYLWAIQ